MSFEKHDSYTTNMNILNNSFIKDLLDNGEEKSSFSTALNNLPIQQKRKSKDSFLIDIYQDILN